MTSQGFARESRAGVFTLVCLSLSVVLHTVAAGSTPSAPAILAGAGLVLVVAFALAGRERRFPLIATVLIGAQFGLHYLFEALPHAGHHGEAAIASVPLPPGMVLAHLVGGLLAALWLRGGEAAAWRLLRWMARGVSPLRGLWFVLWTLVVPASRPALPVSTTRAIARPAPGWRHSVIRRGPPALSAA
ncbi:hypothetical protein [Cryptosporangium arvum]|uniref:Uncharacterized protein n=1 Tax=Cryptosporangium arvum DSM 44712 TaxID=927661 RepID=A0A010ZRF7_9ACTN|nr:hypothetical protein [Cryptosporangium arvum]EXG79762.1 hypothetical protein CryarDRAFT_0807 [Cryptosporangium arvum DSM 44712]